MTLNQNHITMKKLFALFLVGGFLFAFTACDNTRQGAQEEDTSIEQDMNDASDELNEELNQVEEDLEDAGQDVEDSVDAIEADTTETL